MTKPTAIAASLCAASLVLAACGNDIDSEDAARVAYLGLDNAIEKSLKLGFDGFNAANSANIPAQSTTGDESGTLNITGQVDQGASANKGMRLRVGMVEYSDGLITTTVDEDEYEFQVTYDTAESPDAQPALTLSLRDIPNGTFTGTLVGDFQMTGDVEDTATLNLSFSGQLEGNGSGGTQRKLGATTVTGTVTASDGGVYDVNLSI